MELDDFQINLPNGWSLVELKDLVDNPKNDIVDGPFGSNLKSSEYIDSGVPVFKIQNIKANRFIDKNINFVSEKKAGELERHSFIYGDLIITKLGNPLGLCCEVPKKYSAGIIVADLMRIRSSKKKVFDKYLMNVINSVIVQNQFKAITKGTTRPRVNLTIVRGIKLPYPPLLEQYRIVAKIEELFSKLDHGVANLKKAQAQLKTYRQAVLKYAFEGKLTAEWRTRQRQAGKPPEPAEKLLAQIKAEREKHFQQQLKDWEKACEQARAEGKKKPTKPRKPKDLPPLTDAEMKELPELPIGWQWAHLDRLAHQIFDGPFGSNLKTKDYITEGVRVVRLENVGVLEFRNEYKTFISEEKFKQLIKHKVAHGDIIFSSFIGDEIRVCVIPKLIKRAVNKADCFCVRVNNQLISNKYVASFLTTKLTYNQLIHQVHGATRPRVNTTQLKSSCIPVCSTSEQNKLVQEIESRLSVCDKIEQTIEVSLTQAEALRQSILKKAFEGKLVPQDPNDEPAEKLLERIKAEKAKLEAEMKSKKKTVKKRKKKTA